MNAVLEPVLLQGLMKILRNNTEEYVQLHRMLFNPYGLHTPGHLDDVLRGALDTHVERVDPYFTKEVTVPTALQKYCVPLSSPQLTNTVWGEVSMDGYLPTLTDCLWFLRTALGVVCGTQRFPNCTRWFLLSDWRVTSVLGLGVTGACDVVSVTSPLPCARLPRQN
jgi:hypothetical protein